MPPRTNSVCCEGQAEGLWHNLVLLSPQITSKHFQYSHLLSKCYSFCSEFQCCGMISFCLILFIVFIWQYGAESRQESKEKVGLLRGKT